MKSAFLLPVVLVIALSSCTTAYKTGQTPDDVYYSAARPQGEEDKTEKEERRDYTYNNDYYDDRYLRMKVRNRYQWNDLNDWYNYDRYSYGYNYAFGSYNNPYNSWHYFYNPYCCCQGNYNSYSNPKIALIKPVVRPASFNLGGYTNTNYNNSNANGKSATRAGSSRPVYNNSNGKGFSNTIRTIFSGNNNNNNSNSSSSSSSSRTYTPSNNNSSSSSSSSSGSSSSGSSGGSSGGSVSRPTRN